MDTKVIPQNHEDSKELWFLQVNCDVIAFQKVLRGFVAIIFSLVFRTASDVFK